MRRYLFLIGVIAVVFSVTYYFYRVYKYTSEIRKELSSEYWNKRYQLFKSQEIIPGQIVLLGNSLMKGFPEEVLENPLILNRGISGDFTEGIIKRLSEVTDRNPSKIFIEIGINDILAKVPLKIVMRNYETIIREIKKKCPSTQIYILSNLPVSLETRGITSNKDVNERILRQNNSLESLAGMYRVHYINICSQMLKDGKLNSSYSTDGLHMNAEGYKIWLQILTPFLKE